MSAQVYFVGVCLLLAGLAGCKPSLESSDPAVRKAAVEQLADQAALAKVAMEDADSAVREAALHKLTDQALLAKVAISAANANIRSEAGFGLKDQALLAKVALEAKDKQVRYDVVVDLTDQAVLAKIAVDDKDEPVRSAAMERLNDQALLANIAEEAKDPQVRLAAIRKLRDQPALVKIALDDKDPDVRQAAIKNLTPETRHRVMVEWNNSPVDFGKLAGDLGASTGDALEAMARLRLLLANPLITSRVPNLTLDADIIPLSEDYTGGSMPGEKVSFSLVQGTKILASKEWETEFPTETSSLAFERADVVVSGMMAEFFKTAGLAQEDLVKLSQSEIPEVRAGAVADLTDQAVLAKIATTDKTPSVRQAAVEKLTDQALLAKIVADEKNEDVSYTAKDRLQQLQSGKP